MSLATIVGAIVAYPFNVWLVAAKLKHGLGTVRALGEGGHPYPAPARDPDPPPMSMTPAATIPQIAGVTLLSVLILAAGVLLGTLYGELTMRGEMSGHASAREAPMTQSSTL